MLEESKDQTMLFLLEYGRKFNGRIIVAGSYSSEAGADYEYITPKDVHSLPKRYFPRGELFDLINKYGEPDTWAMKNTIVEAGQRTVANNEAFLRSLQ